MTWFILRRLFSAFLVIIGVVTAIFVMSRLIGDPIALMIQPGMTPEDVAQLRDLWHLDDPMLLQYWRFLTGAITGDFGLSIWQSQPALALVLQSLPATLLLTVCAMGLALVVALVLGALSALHPGRWIDRLSAAVTLIGQSMPNFWLALVLIMVFSIWWRLLPPAGIGDLRHLILPTVTLAIFPLARLVRLIRSELIEVLDQDYIRTARSKGVSTWRILYRHSFGNIAISLITVVAVDFGLLMGGAVVTETIFAWPGIGRLMIQAIEHRDFPVMQAAAFVVALVIVLTSLIADLAYALINPRIRYAQ